MTVIPDFRPLPATVPAPESRTDRLLPGLHRWGLTLLRAGLGLLYVWFGVLKVMERSPAAVLVTGTVPGHPGGWIVPALGWFEVALGLWLLTGRVLVLALPVLGAHLCGTFGVLVLMPGTAFAGGNPLMLTLVGEFVVKNLVLLAAVLVVTTGSARRPVEAVAAAG
ncbi:hypothetical protein KNE206_18000 [Kitasatospora sp. NE20-6]|uniref:hypothetical protein n=1 Tax=Kitasatospora sp. NE20-6 TaxID=2859066 RepID=UPI0034DBE2C2